MITLIAFVVLFGLGFCVVKAASLARRAIRIPANQRSGRIARSA
jgi:hypothetical protein